MVNRNDLNFVVTNPDCIYKFDNVIPEKILREINNFDWNKLIWNNTGFSDRLQFATGYYRFFDFISYDSSPSFIEELKNIAIDLFKSIPNNDVTSIEHLTSYAIMSDENFSACKHEIHQDGAEFGGKWSMLYHLIGTEGPTEFYSDFFNQKLIQSYDFIPGRLIIFPSIYPHKGCPQFRDRRLTIDYIFNIKSTLNKNILDNNISLKKKYHNYYTI